MDSPILTPTPDGIEALAAALDVAEKAVADARAELRAYVDASTKRETRLLTATEAAERLPGKALRPNGTPRDSVYALLRRIGGRKHEGKWFIAEDALERYVREGVA
jgi:hypothetical protein